MRTCSSAGSGHEVGEGVWGGGSQRERCGMEKETPGSQTESATKIPSTKITKREVVDEPDVEQDRHPTKQQLMLHTSPVA